jgi:tellurite resistance protein TerC
MKPRDPTHVHVRASPLRLARKIGLAAAGLMVVVVGVALPIPGAGLVLIPLGLGILATEFLWAERLNRELWKLAQRLRPHFL